MLEIIIGIVCAYLFECYIGLKNRLFAHKLLSYQDHKTMPELNLCVTTKYYCKIHPDKKKNISYGFYNNLENKIYLDMQKISEIKPDEDDVIAITCFLLEHEAIHSGIGKEREHFNKQYLQRFNQTWKRIGIFNKIRLFFSSAIFIIKPNKVFDGMMEYEEQAVHKLQKTTTVQ